ncbi:DUF6884 domain-containing protein [Haloplanus pelagicus]|uniref:DUF6884 domain-containing protein n=1 Tax=Haloplanus pelagicus TaxID=2949995 RepID=UPI00203D9F5B|nr:DUF6884 domain-containing protein [Haloplanus sp. HW8-1]
MNILVISGCSGDKQFDEAPIGCEELDSTSRDDLLETYPDYVAPAAEMYTGDEHERVRQAVANLRSYANVTWRIVSAGYGVVAENERIVAYDCTLSDINAVRDRAKRMGHDPSALTIDETRQAVGRELNLSADLKGELAEGYDLVFVTLSEPYLVATGEAFTELLERAVVFVFASKGAKPYVGDGYWVPATEEVRASLGTTWFELRGELLWTFSESVDETALAQLAATPESVEEFVSPISVHESE